MRRSRWFLYAGAVLIALVVAFWKPARVRARDERAPRFSVDPLWPKPLPAPVGADGVAHRWVTGEVAASCTDADDNVYTFNRGFTPGGLVGQDGTPAGAIPSPPVVVYNPAGDVIAAWGNPGIDAVTGRTTYMPNGPHGCFVDYQGYVWLGGNGDGVIQKYNPKTAAMQGDKATWVAQIGTKNVCDGAGGACGENTASNTSHTLLNDPPDIAVDPKRDPVTGTTGSVYIADGYGNHRVVVFTTTDGINYTYNRQFGEDCGTAGFGKCPTGTFGHSGGGHPHCVVLGNDDLVYACDRPDSRIEVFRKTGEFVREIPIDNFPTATPANKAAILKAANRACDMDFYPNIDYLATKSPKNQKYIVNVDLQSDNTYLLDKGSGAALFAFGRCGMSPCPGHNVGEFAYGHMTNVDSKGNVYISETITGRRIQKFLKADDDDDDDGHGHDDH